MSGKHLRTYYDTEARAYISEYEHIFRRKKFIAKTIYPCPDPAITFGQLELAFLCQLENELLPVLQEEYLSKFVDKTSEH